VIKAEARGGLAGVGTWRFFDGRGTAVAYEWDVATTKRWTNAVAPLGRPLFKWNHEVIMRCGRRRTRGASRRRAAGPQLTDPGSEG
jgi:hypothetical protein